MHRGTTQQDGLGSISLLVGSASRTWGDVEAVTELTPEAYTDLLRFRTALRRFDSWSHDQAARVGLSHAQHQLLLAVKGHPDGSGPTIRDVADYLNTRHHSAVGLVDRAERAGLLRRNRDRADGRVVRLVLTPLGEDRIARLSELHLAELAQLAPLLDHLVGDALEQAGRQSSMPPVLGTAEAPE
jgi:DNA-binding MarR family transcriptional regulator